MSFPVPLWDRGVTVEVGSKLRVRLSNRINELCTLLSSLILSFSCHRLPVGCRLGAAGPLASLGLWLSVGNRLNLRLPCVFRVPCPRQAVESRLDFSLQVRVSWCRSHRSSPTSGPGMASLPSTSAYAGLCQCVRSPTRSTRTLARHICHATTAGGRAARPPALL